MNVLDTEKQVRIISALVEGCSIRTIERLTQTHRDTIMRLGLKAGEACQILHDQFVRDLNVEFVELDELWSFVRIKEKTLKKKKDKDQYDPEVVGEQYSFIGMDANRKLIISYVTGKRDPKTTQRFICDLKSRLANRPQITTDGFTPYMKAINKYFSKDVDYAMLTKVYDDGAPPWRRDKAKKEKRYSPGGVIDVKKVVISGNPNINKITTSYIERQNLTLRMSNRRFTRLTSGHSKKLRNHKASIALYAAHYNFCRVHQTLKTTPAVAVGLADRALSIGELLECAARAKLNNAA